MVFIGALALPWIIYLASHLAPAPPRRALDPVSTTMSTRTLPPSVFNRALFRSILKTWFDGVPASPAVPTWTHMSRWYGIGDPAEKTSFDGICTNVATDALSALSPDQFPLPTFTSYAADRENAYELSSPLRAAIFEHQGDSAQGPVLNTLALVLLLDQLSRNSLRAVERQGLIYSHYDRLARSLVNVLFGIAPAPPADTPHDLRGQHLSDPHFRADVARRKWFLMPLMHAEDLASHDAFDTQITALEADVLREDTGVWPAGTDPSGAKFLFNKFREAEKDHRILIERFGRYPHRNEALGRQSTVGEETFLKEGGATFGTDGKPRHPKEDAEAEWTDQTDRS